MKRIGTLWAAVTIGISLTMAALPAAAHDQLVTADPADGSQVAAMPAAITLTFNEPPLAVGSQLVVTTQSGEHVASGAGTVADHSVVLPMDPASPPGVYQVAWRVVSADGHPIQGVISFTVAGPSPSASVATVLPPSPSLSAEPSESAVSVPSPSAAASLGSAPSDRVTTPSRWYLAAGLGVVIMGVGFGWWAIRRRAHSVET